MLETINALITGLAGQPWAYPVEFALCIIDAFFPPLPSESVVISLAALSLAGPPDPWLVWLVAVAGAFVGDNIAYRLGSALGLHRRWWHRLPRVERAFAWAGRQLERRGGVLIIAARYVPVGRLAVNMTAGATGFGMRRFMIFDAIAATTWGTWSVLVGRFGGQWVAQNPALGALAAVGMAMVLGWALDRVVTRLTRDDKNSDENSHENSDERSGVSTTPSKAPAVHG